MQDEIIALLSKLCPDFSKYTVKPNDRYKGSLFGGYNIYCKMDNEGNLGMITGKRNENNYNMNRFLKNFETIGGLHSNQEETGWTGQTLLDLLDYLIETYY